MYNLIRLDSRVLPHIMIWLYVHEEVRRKIQAAIEEYDELLTLVKKLKLRRFGHVSRSYGEAKTILTA